MGPAPGPRHPLGTYAELVTLDAALVAPRPPSLSAVQAASLPLAGATAVQLLDRLAPRPGEWLLVHGAAVFLDRHKEPC